MKKVILSFMFAVAILLSPVTSMAAVDQNIAIVDMQMLMRESKAAVSIKDQMTKLRKGYKKTFSDEESKLRDAEKSLVEKQKTLSKEEFTKEQKAFEKKLVAAQKEVVAKQKKLDKAFTDAMEQLRGKVVQLIANVAEEQQASIVLPRQNIIIIDPGLDLTKDVLKKLDAELAHVDVKVK